MSVTSFEQARQIVEAGKVAPPAAGTYWVSTWGFEEDDRVFVVFTGAREWMVNRDPAFMPAPDGGIVVYVDKKTGTPTAESYVANFDRIQAMTPVGVGHPAWTLRH